MALLDSAYDLFSALEAAQDLSLLAGEAGEDLSELSDFAEAACHQSGPRYSSTGAAQLMPHLQQRRILYKAAAATTRQLEFMSAQLQSAASLASLHGRALECAKVLLEIPTYLPHVWLAHSAPSVRDSVNSQVQRDLENTGLITALGQAMTVAAAAFRRLVPQGQLDMQQLRQLLHLFSYVLALLNAWYACNNAVGNLCTSPPWPSTYPAYAALSAAVLEATPVLSANPPIAAAELSSAGARGGGSSSSSSSRGRGGRSSAGRPATTSARVNSSIGMDESIEHWEDFAWIDHCTRSVQTLAVAAGLLDVNLFTTARIDRRDPHLMDLLGSRDVLSLVVYEAAGIARGLHKAAGGKLPLPAAAAAAAGSSSSSRRSQVQQQQQAVPAYHDLLFEAIGGRSLLKCVNMQGADSQWNISAPFAQRRALGCIKRLRLLLLGQAADPGPDPKCFSTGGIDLGGFADMVTAMAARAPLDTWPPAATFPPERQQQLVGPLMQVVVELLLLVPEDPDGKQGALLEGLELLHHLAGLQEHSAPGLMAMVEPGLLLLGPAVTRAVTQQQQQQQQQQGAASSAWTVEAWQRYGQLLARLLCSVDIAEHAAPIFAKQPAAAAMCEAALRAQLLDAAPASRRQPGRLMSDEELSLLAAQLAGIVGRTTVAVAEASVAAARQGSGRRGAGSSNNSSGVVLPPTLLCLLVSCLKVNSRVGVAAGGALRAASQAASVLTTAVMLCPQQMTAEGGASSTAAARLRQLLENGSLSWAVLAARRCPALVRPLHNCHRIMM